MSLSHRNRAGVVVSWRAIFVAATLVAASRCQLPSPLPIGDEKRFDGQRVLRVFPRTTADVKLLKGLEESYLPELDFWKPPTLPGRPVDVRVPRGASAQLLDTLGHYNVAHAVMIEDLQRAVDTERASRRRRRSGRDLLTAYGSHAEVNQWLQAAAQRCGSRCSVVTVGHSYEGREMNAIRIGPGGGLAPISNTTPAIWIDAGMHGREWIAPAMAINIVNRLISDYRSDVCTGLLLNEFVWYILPIANPDGYEFSRTRNRMWRKNRRPASASTRQRSSGSAASGRGDRTRSCNGTDLNRNFGYQWGGLGVSFNPCADTYAGPNAFSEPESLNMSNFLLGLRSQLTVYLSLHSYGQYWLYPWAYAMRRPDDDHVMSTVAIAASSATFEASGYRTFYNVGSAALTLYPSAGGSDDWAKGVAGVKYSFTAELSPSDREQLPSSGFLIPEEEIPRIAQETWPGVRAMASKVLEFERAAGRSSTSDRISVSEACARN